MASLSSLLDSITDWAVGLMETMGGPGAALAIAMENLFPPIPSEVILPLAGLAAGQGKLNLYGAIAWTTLGSLVGALALYYIGMALGRDRVVAIADKLPLVKVSDIEKTEAWFNKHGGRAVFFGRFIPIFRSFISIPAGLERMHLGKFLMYTALGSLIWNSIFVMVGYLLGDNYTVVTDWVETYSDVIVVLVLIAMAIFLVVRIRSAIRERRESKKSGDEPEQSTPNPHVAQSDSPPREMPFTGTGEPPAPVQESESIGDGYYRSSNYRL